MSAVIKPIPEAHEEAFSPERLKEALRGPLGFHGIRLTPAEARWLRANILRILDPHTDPAVLSPIEGQLRAEACPACRRPYDERRECASCGAVFLLSPEEKDFFVGRGLSLPRCCRRCREARRQERERAGRQQRRAEVA